MSYYYSMFSTEIRKKSMGNGKGSKAKLSQAVCQRWTSICKMLLRLLQKWPALVEVYVRKGLPFPLQDKKREVSILLVFVW